MGHQQTAKREKLFMSGAPVAVLKKLACFQYGSSSKKFHLNSFTTWPVFSLQPGSVCLLHSTPSYVTWVQTTPRLNYQLLLLLLAFGGATKLPWSDISKQCKQAARPHRSSKPPTCRKKLETLIRIEFLYTQQRRASSERFPKTTTYHHLIWSRSPPSDPSSFTDDLATCNGNSDRNSRQDFAALKELCSLSGADI